MTVTKHTVTHQQPSHSITQAAELDPLSSRTRQISPPLCHPSNPSNTLFFLLPLAETFPSNDTDLQSLPSSIIASFLIHTRLSSSRTSSTTSSPQITRTLSSKLSRSRFPPALPALPYLLSSICLREYEGKINTEYNYMPKVESESLLFSLFDFPRIQVACLNPLFPVYSHLPLMPH